MSVEKDEHRQITLPKDLWVLDIPGINISLVNSAERVANPLLRRVSMRIKCRRNPYAGAMQEQVCNLLLYFTRFP